MSRNFELPKISSTEDFSRYSPLRLDFENQILITSNTTFVVPPGTKAVKFTAVGGGQAGVGTTSGAGAGYFEKTFYSPFTGLTTSFQLTIGAANGGNTILRDSAGTTIATAFGATAIGAGATLGIGGTASGGDINSQGSPGGITPGVGGAAGGAFGNSVYDSTYAGRWIYFKESIVNDNVRNYLVNTLETSRGSRVTSIGFNTLGVITAEYGALINPFGPGVTVAGLFANGRPTPGAGGAGGFGGNGGNGPYGGGAGGSGGYGGNGGPGGSGPYSGGAGGDGGYGGNGGPGAQASSGPGGRGGAGGYGGAGGAAARGGPGGFVPVPFPPFISVRSSGPGGNGGPGGFGGGGGSGGNGGSGYLSPYAPPGVTPPARNGGPGGAGGPGGFGGGGGVRGFGGAAGIAPSVAGADGPVGNGGPGAVYIEWTMKEPSKLGA